MVADGAQMIDAAPDAGGGLGGMLGGLMSSMGAGKFGNLAELAGGFSKLGLDVGKVTEMLPVVLQYLKDNVDADLLQKIQGLIKP